MAYDIPLPEDDSKNLQDYLDATRRRGGTALKLAGVLLVVGLLAILLWPNRYLSMRRWTSGVPLLEEYAPPLIAAPRQEWRQGDDDGEADLAPPPDEAWQTGPPAVPAVAAGSCAGPPR